MESMIAKSTLLSLMKNNNLMDLLPKALNVEKEPFKITPSEFIKEMSLTTEERYKKLMHTANAVKSKDDCCPSHFKIIPNILIFQKFQARMTYSLILSVKNIGKTLLPLKMTSPSSLYFSTSFAGKPTNKLAPGLSIDYVITFVPKEIKDYSHQIVFRSKEDTFYVPIVAIGYRPLLDIPDHIVFDPVPVKITASKLIVVRNIGDAPAVFNFISKCFFKVIPSKGVLGIHESMLINIFFESFKIGEVTEPLYLMLETGEKLTITLHGAAENVGVRLTKNSVTFQDTFIGLKQCKIVQISNSSNSTVKFSWKIKKSLEDDLAIIESMKDKYKELEETEILKDTKLNFVGLSNEHNHKLSCRRILEDELQLLEAEEFQFTHESFSILPEKGELRPKDSVEVMVSFEPKFGGVISTEAYLEVSGRDSRLPLKMRGNGLGPKIVLNVKTLDIDYIYLCSIHKYEVVATNKGDICGTLQYKPDPLVFGGKVEVMPEKRNFKPGESGAYVVSFTSNRPGDFTEQLTFNIKESNEKIILILKGKIISPTLHFDTRQIDFGIIPVGFPTNREVTLNNLSMVPVTFSLKVLSDGEVPSLSIEDFAALMHKPTIPRNPKEFQIDPEESVVEPFSNKKVNITLTANRAGHFLTYLVVDMWDSESGTVSCPISFHPQIATIISDPEVITIPFCFLNFPYTRSITLKNISKVGGFFYILPPVYNLDLATTYSANIPQGIIEPHSDLKIDITLMTTVLGRQIIPINILIFGYEDSRQVCTISCVGQGPVVRATPDNLAWEDLPLLLESQKILVLSNESPIPATLSLFLAKANSPWSVNPSNFTLAPEKSINVLVKLVLNDRGKFTDTLKVIVHNGKELSIALNANGVGSSLKITPNISPKYDLGTLFSFKKYEMAVVVENKGTKSYGVLWSPYPDYKVLKLGPLPEFIFKIEPYKIDLSPGESKIINLVVFSPSPGYFSQNLYCFSVPSKELILTSEVFADFVEPLISFDKTELTYWYNVGSDGIEQHLEDEIEVKNLSVLPICISISITHPFQVKSDTEEWVNNFETNLTGNECKIFLIKFLPKLNDRISRFFKEYFVISFRENSKKCSVALNGEINYPNVCVLPKNINFGYVPVGANVYREINLINTSPFTIYYQITWNSLTSKLDYPKNDNLLLTDNSDLIMEMDENEHESTSADLKIFGETSEIDELENKSSTVVQQIKPKPMPDIASSKSDIKIALFSLVRKFYNCDEEVINVYRLSSSSTLDNFKLVPDYTTVCDITPFYGKLDKYSSQILAVRFSCDTSVNFHGEALLSLYSGPTEVITVEAKSGEISFHLDQIELNFGKQLFCETKSQMLKLQNTGVMPFSYEANTQNTQHCHVKEEFNFSKGNLTISPNKGDLDSFAEVNLNIQYHPGIPGMFEDKFQVKVGYLDSVTITLKGHGVFPQVCFSLPRPDMLRIPVELGYLAVSSITSDWFLTEMMALENIADDDWSSFKAYRSEESNLNSISENVAEFLQDNWDYILREEAVPSRIDIYLAIERILAKKLISKDPMNNVVFAVYARTIPQFCVPAYLLDFGIVIVGQTVEKNITVTNYGPLPAVMYNVFKPQLKLDGIYVRLRNRNELDIGTCLPFTIRFSPKQSKYKKRIEQIENTFHFEVYHGPKIPIIVRAKVTYPHVIPSIYTLNYNEVICGYCKVMTLKLKNPGLVPAFWSLMFAAQFDNPKLANHNDGRLFFHMNNNSGCLAPGEYCGIQISFKPDFAGSFSVTLWVEVAESLEELKIVLLGEGIEPKLRINETSLHFGPTLPYPNKLEKYFVVENPCSFPIEFYLPDFDDQIFEEDKILRAVSLYYQTKEILLPVRKPGEGLPVELINFYQMLLNDVNTKFMEQEREKADNAEENLPSFFSTEDDPNVSPSQVPFTEKKNRKAKKNSRLRSTIGTSRNFSSSLHHRSTKEFSSYSVYEKKTTSEIEGMLQEHIKELLNSGATYDPIQAALKTVIPPVLEEQYKEGVLVIFHGAPFTNYIQLANKASVITGFPIFSIDRIVLEEAAFGRCEAGLIAKDLIEQAYWSHAENVPQQKISLNEMEEGGNIGQECNFSVAFEEIERKFNFLVSSRENTTVAKVKATRKSSSTKSERSKKPEKDLTTSLKSLILNSPVANITEDLVADILKFRLSMEVNPGVIIEGLQSVLINSSSKVLLHVLKAVGNIKDIFFICLINNYVQFNNFCSEKEKEKERIRAKEEEDLLLRMERDPAFSLTEIKEEERERISALFSAKRQEICSVFEEKKNNFYKSKKFRKESKKKDIPVTTLFVNTVGAFSNKIPKEKDKKKDPVKGVKTSDDPVKNRRDMEESEFASFEIELIELRKIIDGWDQRIGEIVNDTLDEQTKKEITSKKEFTSDGKLEEAIGVREWLINVSRPNSNVFPGVCYYLKSILRSRHIPQESDNWPLKSPESMTFSVVSFPPVRPRTPILDIYTLSPLDKTLLLPEDTFEDSFDYTPSALINIKLNRSASQISFKSRKKACLHAKSRETESRMSYDTKSNKNKHLSNTGIAGNSFKARWVLLPGESLTWRVKYFPVETGMTEQIYSINIVNCDKTNYVRCVGLCDIPAFDTNPEIMFSSVATARPIISLYAATFFYSENAYDFGSIITFLPLEGKKTPEKSTTFTLLNKSNLPAEVTVISSQDSTAEDSTGSCLKFDPNNLFLETKEAGFLTVTAKSIKYGPTVETLTLITKNNPRIESIKVKWEGVKAHLTVEPKHVNFDRLLLHRKDFRRVVFTNFNLIPLFIRLCNLKDLPNQFIFSHVSGWISPLEIFMIEIQYSATEVQLIHEEPILVQVYDDLQAEPVLEFSFAISVEAYDVALDITFSNKEDDHIDFGDIRVENEYSITFTLRNAGKYVVGYKIDIDDKILKEADNDQFFVSPEEGKLSPVKAFPVTVSFTAKNEVVWRRLPLFKILLFEPISSNDSIATIPIEVSARSFFARFEIKPLSDFNFGHVRVGSAITRTLLVENKGRFPLSYFLGRKTTSMQSHDNEDLRKKSFKLSPSKETRDKSSLLVLNLDIFHVSPSTGIVEVGQSARINITCSPSEVLSYKEKFVVFVNESLPQLKEGNEITITAEGCLPKIDFDDVKTIFREHFVCNNEEEFTYPGKVGTYTLFSKNTQTFSFKNVCVCKTVEARIHLPNAGLIECRVTASIVPEVNSETGNLFTTDENIFDVTPKVLLIEPYDSATLTLTFCPEAIEVYKKRLLITLEMPDTFKDYVQTIELTGNGILPLIDITEPTLKSPEGVAIVNFPITCPGRHSTSSIAFSNVGLLDSKVILEPYKNQEGAFTLKPKSCTKKLLKTWELAKPIDHTIVLSISPGEVANFNVFFHPKEVKSYTSYIKVFVYDNPYENLCFKLIGDVYFEEVLIEEIPKSLILESGITNDFKLIVQPVPGCYTLKFGDCYVKKKIRALIRLSNKTERDYFKFGWEEFQNITISPSDGHLYPNCYKDIQVVFMPEEPIEVENVPLICKLNKIVIKNPPNPSWDSRLIQFQKLFNSETNLHSDISDKKEGTSNAARPDAKISGEEPEFDIVQDSKTSLTLNIFAVGDYARLTCETTKIIFKNTFMFQTRLYPLTLENSGKVPLEYKLVFKSISVRVPTKCQMSQTSKRSFSKTELSQSRPRSSVSSRGTDGQVKKVKSVQRPRPLSGVSILELNKNLSNQIGNETTIKLYHEEKVTTYNPFSISKMSGVILAKEKANCNIIFSPLDMQDYIAVIHIEVPNLHPECTLPKIHITASSVMPYCHFSLPESDYLKSGRRDFSRPGPIGYAPGIPLSRDTKTVEIKVLGVGQTIPIKFPVINPTEEDYTFSWVNINQMKADVLPSFHCSTLDGQIQAGRQQIMFFSFVAQNIGITESFWKFCIPKYGVETPFLFVSEVREPAVYCLSKHINLRSTFIGSTSSETLTIVNNEEIPFDFNFVPDSFYSVDGLNMLRVDPVCGKIPANSEVHIRIMFTGKMGGKAVFYLKCRVKNVQELLTTSVEIITYVVQPLVVFEDLKKVKHYANSEVDTWIDFGAELVPKCPETISFFFTSVSKSSFFYEWIYDRNFLEQRFCKLRFSVERGHVTSFSRGKCDLTIVFLRKSFISNFPVTLKISRGPTFYFKVSANASTPACKLSFRNYDFGYRFIQGHDFCFYKVPLIIKNQDTLDLGLECHVPKDSAFTCSLPQEIIPSGEEMTIFIHFYPRESILYTDTIKFIVNGIHEKIVHLKGHGTDFKVELQNCSDKIISMGAVRVGVTSTRKLSLVNKSLIPATVLVGFSDQLPVGYQNFVSSKESTIDLSEDHRLSNIIKISPSTVFTIKPQQIYTLNIAYTPTCKTKPFSEKVSIQKYEKVEPLCVITGCGVGPQISLDRDFLNFGAVVEGCKNALKCKIINSGSIGSRFEWDITQLGKDYSLSPVAGYCSAESDVTVEVVFNPVTVTNCIKKKVECKLHLSHKETYPSLFLSLIGECINMPQPSQIISFKCVVRETDKKTVEINNWSGNTWQLVPTLRGDYFSGYDVLLIPPLSTAEYEIVYYPLTMTKDDPFHEGTLFFRLPNGEAILYELQGEALPPNPLDVIVREVPCKTKYVELLKIQNWLKFPQRFKVNILCTTFDNDENSVWTCNGLGSVELPASAEKEYSLSFFSYKMGQLRFKVFFENEENREYQWYDITFNIVSCGPLEIITLKSGVRQPCYHKIKLENPLPKNIQYKLESTCPEIHSSKSSYELLPYQTIEVDIWFTPIFAEEKTEDLVVSCEELGSFPRELRLISVTVQPGPPRVFKTPLGFSQTQTIDVLNMSHLGATLQCKVDSDSFYVQEKANAASGQTVKISVTYEPSEIGSTVATLEIESEQAGNYTFPLLGFCGKPPAKGPFVIKAGSNINIPFKNVFKTEKNYQIFIDNPAFILKTNQEKLLPKEECKIYVGLQPMKKLEKLYDNENDSEIEPRFPIMGQLLVECMNPYVRWQFYLKGILV